jgi:hypothetical protein
MSAAIISFDRTGSLPPGFGKPDMRPQSLMVAQDCTRRRMNNEGNILIDVISREYQLSKVGVDILMIYIGYFPSIFGCLHLGRNAARWSVRACS